MLLAEVHLLGVERLGELVAHGRRAEGGRADGVRPRQGPVFNQNSGMSVTVAPVSYQMKGKRRVSAQPQQPKLP